MLLRSFLNVKTGRVSLAMVATPLSSMLWTHTVLSRAGYNYWIVSRSGCIRILSRSLDRESTNGSPCLVEEIQLYYLYRWLVLPYWQQTGQTRSSHRLQAAPWTGMKPNRRMAAYTTLKEAKIKENRNSVLCTEWAVHCIISGQIHCQEEELTW